MRLFTRSRAAPPRLPYGLTPRVLGRGLAKLVAAIAVAALVGLGIGAAGAQLSDDSDSPPDGSPGSAAPSGQGKRDIAQRATPANVRVRILAATLLPATSASGQRRQRARLSVRVRVTNRSRRAVRIARPVLVSGGARVKTDANAVSPTTSVETLDAETSKQVTLRFEIAGAVTRRVREGRVRLLMAGVRTTSRLTSQGDSGN